MLAGRELLVWGDVLAADPDLLAGLPDGVTVCEWGYEDNHPFAERAERLAAAGVPFWMCPGTSSWLSISGRVENMIGNIRSAAVAGIAHGATGILTTDWGDMGHHQQPVVSEPGFASGGRLRLVRRGPMPDSTPTTWPPSSTSTPSTIRPAPSAALSSASDGSPAW